MDTERRLAESLGIPVEIKQIKISGHTINYCTAGSGPPLLLIHGANFGWGVWYPNIPFFAKHFKVYAIDLPGAGRSSPVDYKKLDPQKDLVDVTDIFLRQLDLNNLKIIGCSVGGWLAMKMALLHPSKVIKVLVENSVGFSEYMSFSDKLLSVYPFAQLLTKTILKANRNNKNIEKFLRSIFYNSNLTLKKEFIDYFYETMSISHNLLFISRLSALEKNFVIKNELPSIKQPVLITWGQEDKIMPLTRNESNFSLIPNYQYIKIKSAGHIPSLEKSNEFNEAALNFLL